MNGLNFQEVTENLYGHRFIQILTVSYFENMNYFSCLIHTCHKLWTEICEIRQIFKGDSIKFCETFDKNHFGAPTK